MPELHVYLRLYISDFAQPMRAQIFAMKRAYVLGGKNTDDEVIKSLVEEGFSVGDAENALRKLTERGIAHEYKYTWREKRHIALEI